MKRIAVWIIGLAVVVAGLVLVRPGWLGLSSKPEAVISSTPRVMYGPVKLGGKWGFIGTTGKILIDPQFDGAHRFDKGSGLAAVKLGGKWGYIIERKIVSALSSTKAGGSIRTLSSQVKPAAMGLLIEPGSM